MNGGGEGIHELRVSCWNYWAQIALRQFDTPNYTPSRFGRRWTRNTLGAGDPIPVQVAPPDQDRLSSNSLIVPRMAMALRVELGDCVLDSAVEVIGTLERLMGEV